MGAGYRDIIIPKKTGMRKISVPSKELLKEQRKELKTLNKLLERELKTHGLSDVINGFRRGKNCVTAAKQHIGYDCTVILDIRDFFDNCLQSDLIDLYPSLKDKTFLFHRLGYCAQGFATSPVLSNLVIIPILLKLKETLSYILKDYCLTTYADDFQISFNLNNSQEPFKLQNQVISIVEAVVKSFNFEVKSSKTRIRYAKYGYRRILGINVGQDHIRASRKTMRKIRAATFQQNYHSVGGLQSWAKCIEPKPKQYRKASSK